MATNFPIDLLRRLNEPEREFVIVAHIRRQPGLPGGGGPNGQVVTDVHFIVDPLPAGVQFVSGSRTLLPVAKKLGRILAFQDTGLFGNAQGSTTVETSNEPDGILWPPVFLTDSIRVSDILDTGNLIGLEAQFLLLAECYGGNAPELADYARHWTPLALDSPYDYDPFWAKCVELKVAPAGPVASRPRRREPRPLSVCRLEYRDGQ